MKPLTYIAAPALCLALAFPAAFAQTPFASSTTTSATVTNATGTISQLNYGPDGQVAGFLLGTTTLLSFPAQICGGAGTLGAAGNSVTYSGTSVTSSSGFVSVQVSSFTNNTTKATYTAPATSSASTYGPTSGTVKQLNYSPDGTIDGFLFTASGSTLFVSIGYTSSATLTSLLTTGATVSVTGATSPGMSACTASATLETVRASSLTIGSTTVVIQGGGPGGFGPGGPGGPRGGH